MSLTVEVTGPQGPACTLAEGPRWDETGRRLLWVDIDNGLLLAAALDGGRLGPAASRPVGATLGAVAPAADGSILAAAHDRLVLLRPDGSSTRSRALVADGHRFNDGAVDPAGRFLVGTLALGQHTWQEQLLRIEPDGGVTVLDDDLGLSNGLGWSADGTRLYSVDSERHAVFVREYDAVSGATGARRTWVEIDDGFPDGIAVDVEDHVWVAVWGAGEIRRFSPLGELVDIVRVPAPHTSAVGFAGPARDVLVVSTACKGLDAGQLAAFPASGHLFTGHATVPGLPATPWAVGPLPL